MRLLVVGCWRREGAHFLGLGEGKGVDFSEVDNGEGVDFVRFSGRGDTVFAFTYEAMSIAEIHVDAIAKQVDLALIV